MMINTIKDFHSIQTTSTAKTEAVQAGKPDETTQMQQNSPGKTANSPQAVLVALENIITTELSELSQTVANRAALIKSLPPEIRELVQQLLSQNQAAQTTLQEGLVTLLKSSKTGAEKLAMLADIMEQAAGLTPEESQGAAAKQFEMPQRQGNLSNNSQNLSTKLVVPTGDSVKPQELAQLLKAFATQPELAQSLPPEIKKLVLTILQQEEPASPAGQTKSNRQNPSTQQMLLPDELTELTQTIAKQTAKSVPPENREPIQQLLSQNQDMQTGLQAGVAALLKSSKTKTGNPAIPPDSIDGQEEASGSPATGKQQLQTELTAALQGKNPGDLQEMAKVLRQLIARSNVPGNQQEGQAAIRQPDGMVSQSSDNAAVPTKPAVIAGDSAKPQESAQLLKAFTAQPELAQSLPPEIRKIVLTLLQQEESGQAQAAQTILPEAGEGQGPKATQPQMTQRQENSPNTSQNLPAKAAMSAGDSAKPQELAQLLKAFATQPELTQSLPPEIRKLVLTLLQQEEPASPTAQTTQTSAQTTQNQKLSAQQIPNPTSQSSPTLTAQVSSPQTRQLLQTLPAAVAELVIALKKSEQSPIEKIIVFASILEQAAELLTPNQPQAAQSFGLSQQAMMELANIWQGKSPEEVKAAIKVVRELAETMSKSSGVTAERQDAQRVLTIAVPLYFGDGQTVYPAYIHVYYQEEEDKKNPGRKVTETWLRICLETENIGMVDAAFRLYDGNNLDVKVRFTDAEAASGFADSMEEVREQLGQLPLTLGEFLVR